MAANPTPLNDDVALALAEDLADGCQMLEGEVGIKQNTEAVMRAAIEGALQTWQAYKAANGEMLRRSALLQAADKAGESTLVDCKLRLSKYFGQRYSGQWAAAGWPGKTVMIPDSQDLRFTLLLSLQKFFELNPALASVDMEATEAICGARHEEISDARAALHNAEVERKQKMKARKAAMKTLRKRIRGLIEELATVLPDDDARYLTFGLNVPSRVTAPGGIKTLTLLPLGGGRVLAQWSYAKRMGRTRLLLRRAGEAEFGIAGTVDGLEKTLEKLPPGAEIEVQAVPYNSAGDGPGSPVVKLLVPVE